VKFFTDETRTKYYEIPVDRDYWYTINNEQRRYLRNVFAHAYGFETPYK